MKKMVLATMLVALVSVVPMPTLAAVDISVTIGLPPPIVFEAPPAVMGKLKVGAICWQLF